MLKRVSEHGLYYVSLVVILILAFLLAYNNSYGRSFQIGVITITTFFYVLWGIMHHLLNHDLHAKIVIEYILIGAFGLTVIFFLLSVGNGY